MSLIEEIYMNFLFYKNDNLITNKGILQLYEFTKNNKK